MRALFITAAIFAVACQSGVALSVEGDLQYPCTRENDDLPRRGTCPGELFCGADSFCHTRTKGAAYRCNDDLDCAGGYRCGPAKLCLDPSGDALHTEGPEVNLMRERTVEPKTPWRDAGVLAAGPTFYNPYYGPLSDVTPIAVAQSGTIHSVLISRQGFTPNSDRVFVGAATVPQPVSQLAVARQQVFAIAGDRTYHYVALVSFDGGQTEPVLNPGTGVARIGNRLRSGGSAFPLVAEFSEDGGAYRFWDSAKPFGVEGAPHFSTRLPIDDIADSDGRLIYAAMGGALFAVDKTTLGNPLDPDQVIFSSGISLVSPGRNELLTNCSGNAVAEPIYVRAIHVGDNPDLSQVEHPLVALEVDTPFVDGGHSLPRWVRIDPDPLSDDHFGSCGLPRHVVRGNCVICSGDERLIDLQWGTETDGTPVLRAQCEGSGTDSSFYDLTTDATGFACFRTRRLGVGYGGPSTALRARSSAQATAVAVGDTVLMRRSGLDTFTPLTLDRPPLFAQEFSPALVALGSRTMYRETPHLGLTLSSFGDATGAFPTWVTGSWLLYDDGRVGPVANLARPPADGTLLAAPSRRDLEGPISGTSARGSNGHSYLVMSAFDALLGVDLSTSGGPLPSVDVKTVPEPQVQVLSVAAIDGDAGSLFTGYVLTENRVFALDAVSDQRWNLAPVSVADGEWRKVWTDRGAGRLGYDDGVVYGLPSAVQIAPRFGRVLDYLQFCGRSWALTADGIYRLDASSDGGPIGDWTKQNTALPADQKWGRMYVNAAGELWVFSQTGYGVGLKGNPCP